MLSIMLKWEAIIAFSCPCWTLWGIRWTQNHGTCTRTNVWIQVKLLCWINGNIYNNVVWLADNKMSAGKNGRVPDFVFLAHAVDLSSCMHQPFVNRSMASLPYYTRIYLIPFLPFSFMTMLLMWAKSKAFLCSFYTIRGRLHQTWAVPRFGFQVCLVNFDLIKIHSKLISHNINLYLLFGSISCHLQQMGSITLLRRLFLEPIDWVLKLLVLLH